MDLCGLRKLLHRERGLFKIDRAKTETLGNDTARTVRSVIRTIRSVYGMHLAVLRQDWTIIDRFEGTRDKYPERELRAFQKAVDDLGSHERMSACITTYLSNAHNNEDVFLLSFLPGMFTYLWSLEEVERAVDVILSVEDKFWPCLVRILLVHPTTFAFLMAMQNDAMRLPDDIIPSHIVNLFISKVFVFPTALRILLTRVDDPCNVFITSVLIPVLSNPVLYGLLSPDKTRKLLPAGDISRADVAPFMELVLKKECRYETHVGEAELPSGTYEDGARVFFTSIDCDMLRDVVGSELPANRENCICALRRMSRLAPVAEKSKERESAGLEEDEFEALVRGLVMNLNVGGQGTSIDQVFEEAMYICPDRLKLRMELQLDQFKTMKEQRAAPDDVQYYITLLMNAYTKRMEYRKRELLTTNSSDMFRIQQHQATIAMEHAEARMHRMRFNEWVRKRKPFAPVSRQIQKLCTNSSAFASECKRLVSDMLCFIDKSAQLDLMDNEHYAILVYRELTSIINVTEFRKYNDAFVQQDQAVELLLSHGTDEIRSNNSQPFIQPLLQNQPFIDLITDNFRQAFEHDSVVPTGEAFYELINTLVESLNFQGLRDIGADCLLPVMILLSTIVKPSGIVSLAMYLQHCLLTLPPPKPIQREFEYSATTYHTVAMFLHRQIQQ